MARPPTAALAAAAGLALALTACASGASNSASSTPTSTTTSTTTSAPASNTPGPVVTESNPPGDIPDNQLYVTYKGASGVYAVNVPEGWARTDAGSTTTFVDKLNSIKITQRNAKSAATVASATAALAALKQTSPNLEVKGVAPFTRAGGSGVVVTYKVDSTPDPVTNKVIRNSVEQYHFWKNGKEVVLILTGAQNADNVDPWAKVTNSYRWLK